ISFQTHHRSRPTRARGLLVSLRSVPDGTHGDTSMADFSRISECGDDRGHCKGCKWWQAEHDGPGAEDVTVGLCLQPELTHFSLQVSGLSGWNRYEAWSGAGAERMPVGAATG